MGIGYDENNKQGLKVMVSYTDFSVFGLNFFSNYMSVEDVDYF